MGAEDIFAELFGGAGGFGFNFGPDMRPRRARGEDSVIHYDVTLEDLYNGKSVKMNMEKEIVCGVCKGYVLAPSFLIFIVACLIVSNDCRSGAKGSAKPKQCAKREGKGWTFVHSSVCYPSSVTLHINTEGPPFRWDTTRLGPQEHGVPNVRVMVRNCERKTGKSHLS